MTTEPFARFLERTGHRVLSAGGVDWYDGGRGFFLSVPSHRLLTPTEEALGELFAVRGVYGVRFPAPISDGGKLSYQIVCDDPEFGLEKLSGNVRSKVRRGLKRCEVRPATFEELARHGREADRDTMERQGRRTKLAGKSWDDYWAAAADTEGMEGWAAFVGDQLASFLVTVRFSDGPVEFLLARSRSETLAAYPNNALIFGCTEVMLRERGVPKITFGLESLEPVGPLDQFKFSMGFRAQEVRQRVVFHPVLRRVLGFSPVRKVVYRWGSERGPEGGFWRKATGLLRFAEEGGDLASQRG
jgi:hypothetical protein